jgi:hypothetical protein
VRICFGYYIAGCSSTGGETASTRFDHKSFSVEKARDPDSARQPQSLKLFQSISLTGSVHPFVSVNTEKRKGLRISHESGTNHFLASTKKYPVGYLFGGGGEIRTHDRVSPMTVFKTVPFNRSGTPPGTHYFISGFFSSSLLYIGDLRF